MNLPVDVFLVQHVHIHNDGAETVKLIGIYTSRANAEQAIERLKQQPGFRDVPEGFVLDQYTLDEDNWTEGFVTVKHRLIAEGEQEEQKRNDSNETSDVKVISRVGRAVPDAYRAGKVLVE